MPLPSLTDDLESQRLTKMSRKEPPEDCLEEARRRLGSKHIDDEQVDEMELQYQGIISRRREKTDKSKSFDDGHGHSDELEDVDGAELVITRTDGFGESSKTIYRAKDGEQKLEGFSSDSDESLDSYL